MPVLLLALPLSGCGGRSALEAGGLDALEPDSTQGAAPGLDPLPEPGVGGRGGGSSNPGGGGSPLVEEARGWMRVGAGRMPTDESPPCPVASYQSLLPLAEGESYVVNGQDRASVSCQVGGRSSFSGQMSLDGVGLEISNLRLQDLHHGTGDVVFTEARQFPEGLFGTSCDFEATYGDDDYKSAIEGGSFNMSFSCVAVSSRGYRCVSGGAALFENCTQR